MMFLSESLLWLAVAIPLFWIADRFGSEILGHPQLSIHKRTWKGSLLGFALTASMAALWATLVVAVAVPQIARFVQETKYGAVIAIAQDTSSSMKNGVTNEQEIKLAGERFYRNWQSDQEKKKQIQAAPAGSMYYNPGLYAMQASHSPDDTPSEIRTAEGAIRQFIEHSHGNRIGLFSFDDAFYGLYPPTDYYKVIVEDLHDFEEYLEVQIRGTNFDGPSAANMAPGALQGGVDTFEEIRHKEPNVTAVYIMVTDGDSKIDEARATELAAEYKRLKINLLVFGIGDDWAKNAATVQPLKNFVASVGGMVVPVADAKLFQQAVDRLDALATSGVYKDWTTQYQDIYRWLLIAAALFGIIHLLCRAIARKGF